MTRPKFFSWISGYLLVRKTSSDDVGYATRLRNHAIIAFKCTCDETVSLPDRSKLISATASSSLPSLSTPPPIGSQGLFWVVSVGRLIEKYMTVRRHSRP